VVPAARATTTRASSSGWRSASRTREENSGSSSRNGIPCYGEQTGHAEDGVRRCSLASQKPGLARCQGHRKLPGPLLGSVLRRSFRGRRRRTPSSVTADPPGTGPADGGVQGPAGAGAAGPPRVSRASRPECDSAGQRGWRGDPGTTPWLARVPSGGRAAPAPLRPPAGFSLLVAVPAPEPRPVPRRDRQNRASGRCGTGCWNWPEAVRRGCAGSGRVYVRTPGQLSGRATDS
jgi:hypothetical protein